MITVVGESLIDVVHHPDGRVQRSAGGSPANVALGLARLGQDVQLLTSFGADDDGRLLRETLTRDGVQVHATTSTATSTATAHLDDSGAATYTFNLVNDPADDPADDPLEAGGGMSGTSTSLLSKPGTCLHTGSLAALSPASRNRIHRLLVDAKPRTATSFDPNCRPTLMGSAEQARTAVEDYLGLSDIVKVSDEDLAWLYPGKDPHDVARHWLTRGPALVVLTLGSRGCFATTRTCETHVPSLTVDVADTVGAGDSFTAALLDTLDTLDVLGAEASNKLPELSVADLESVLLRAVSAAALTCSRPGANPSTTAELDAVLSAVVPVM